MQNTYSWLGLGVAIAVLLAGTIFFITHKNAPITGGTVSTTTPSTGTTTNLGNGISVNTSGGASIEAVPNSTVQHPPISDTVVIASSLNYPPEVQAKLRSDEATVITQIRKDPTRVDLWLKLGVYRKMAGDYQGAIEAWNYVAAAAPAEASFLAYGDLGDLYMNFQVNYPKAEANYKAAIAIKPTVIDYYKDLYTLYTSFYKKGTSAATDIVAQGLKANPNNPDLLQLQAQLNSSAR